MNEPEISPRFPPVEMAIDDGLLMVGGLLTPNWVITAYRQGIFPWPIVDGSQEILAWFSPDPRAVIEFAQFRISRRLARRIRSERFRVTCDQQFAEVVRACAQPRRFCGETWITPSMADVYCTLHQMGHAHSIEVWEEDSLVGGLYGIALGGFFAGESMFFRKRDASKVALAALVFHLEARGFSLFDVQQATGHIIRMGGREIARKKFMNRLRRALERPVSFGTELDTTGLESMIHRE